MVTAGHRELKFFRFCVFCNIFYFRSLQIITKNLAFCFHTKYFYLKKISETE